MGKLALLKPTLAQWALPKIKCAHIFLALITLTLAAYANSFAGVFQFDDWNVIVNDARVQSLASWWQSFPQMRTLFKLSVALNHELGNLFGFHAVNLALHLANLVLLFRLLAQLLPLWLPVRSAAQRDSIRLFTCTVFALHPVQTEVVTYISGRSLSLSLLFVLIALHCAQRFITQSRINKGERGLLVLSLCAYGAAVASRETTLLFPLLLMLLRPLPGARSSDNAQQKRWRLLLLMHGAMLLLLLVLLFSLPAYRALLAHVWSWSSLPVLLAQQTQSLAHLLAVFFFQSPLNADPQLDILALNTVRGAGIAVMIGTAALVVITLALFSLRSRQALPTALKGRTPKPTENARSFSLHAAVPACLWLLYAWLPSHSLLLRDDAVNDRQWYSASIGMALALSLLGLYLLQVLSRRLQPAFTPASKTGKPQTEFSPTTVSLLALAMLTAMALALAHATYTRNQVYSSELRFWYAVIEHAPQASRPWNNLGYALACAGQKTAAISAFSTAQTLANGAADATKADSNLALLHQNALPCPTIAPVPSAGQSQ